MVNISKIVREFHQYYYRPNNLQLIVTGKIQPDQLLHVLNTQVEPILIKHGQNQIPEGWKRPFLETPSKGGARLEKSTTVHVEFPEKDESSGEVQISWVGPNTNVSRLDQFFPHLQGYSSIPFL